MRVIKSSLQKLLRGISVYHRCKASALYDIYWRFADRRLLESRSGEVAFFRQLLAGFSPGDWIFDIGANDGFKCDVFLRLGAQVLAVDPDETNQSILAEKFHKYRLRRKPVKIVGKAVSDVEGTAMMWLDRPGSWMNTLSSKWVSTLQTDETRFGTAMEFSSKVCVPTTTLDHLIRENKRPFFIKIDVEGFEANVLRGLTSPVPYLSFEVNLPEFRAEGRECVHILNRLDPNGRFNYSSDLQRGLALSAWKPHTAFFDEFDRIAASSIEIFWKTI